MLGNLAKSLIPIAIMGGLQYAQQGGGAPAATLSATAQSFLDSTDPERDGRYLVVRLRLYKVGLPIN